MHKGHCECGAVAFEVENLRPSVTMCHCAQCRRLCGHHWAAAHAKFADVTFTCEDGLAWFTSSMWAKRGFCNHCGSSLFYRANDSDEIGIAAGSFDVPTGLVAGQHIFVANKGDYYTVAHDAPHIEKY